VIGADQDRQIAGHIARLHGLDADLFESLTELHHVRHIVEGAAVFEVTGPSKNRGERIDRGPFALLMLAAAHGTLTRHYRMSSIRRCS
jgi:hypothetical protein